MAQQESSMQTTAGARAQAGSSATYVRFSPAQRIEHIVLLVSFTLLALTGLPQKYAGTAIGEWAIRTFGGIEGIRVIHHTAAIVFVLLAVYDLIVLLYKIVVLHTELGMLPGIRDLTDVIGALRYNLGLSKERPALPRYSYEEKAEYWAMLWGTVVMALTGFMLWNPIMFTKFLPGELIPAAKAAHGAEALLAVLAIIVWHFYNVHLKAWNSSMWTGRLSEHQMAEEHGEELARIKNGQVRPAPAPAVRRQRMLMFAPIALVIAVASIGAIAWLTTAEKTAITTMPRSDAKAFVPLPPTLPPSSSVGLNNAQIGKPIPHAVAGKEQCDTCHGPQGVKPYPEDHALRPNISCQVCHSPSPAAAAQTPNAAGAGQAGGPAAIPHPIAGREDCQMCHKQDGVQPVPADHAGRGNDTCTACHKLAAGISGTPEAQATPAAGQTPAAGGSASGPKPVPHDLAGKEQCALCHSPSSSIKPAPQDHEGRANDTCTACHKPADSAAAGTQAASGGTTATPAAPAAAGSGTAASGGPKLIPADHAGRPTEWCVACHSPDSRIRPAPQDHAGRTGETCATCHKAAS